MTPADDTPADRLHALDNLRATMMWLGIVLHVAVIHLVSPSPLPWHDDRSTPVADFVTAFIHAFRMPVFFLLAGFFVALMVRRKGAAGMLHHRLRRLALPFAIFWPLLFAVCGLLALLFLHRMARGTWGLDRSLLPPSPGVPKGPSTMHLWFLWMLLWFSVFSVPLHWVMARLPHRVHAALAAVVTHLGEAPWGCAVLALPLAWLGSSYPNGVLTPNGSFLPPLAEWLHNGLFFVFGTGVFLLRERLFAHWLRHWPLYAAAGGVCFLLTGILMETLAHPEASAFALFLATGVLTEAATQPGTGPQPLLFAIALAYNTASWLWSFALIGIFLRHVQGRRAWLAWLADSSYWLYLVHLPLTIAFGALLYGLPLPALAKMLINVAATTAVCLVSYHFLVRSTAIGALLNGRRYRPIHSSGEPFHAH
ncbi:acyltransferase family protein [Acidovorax sp. A1169]|uniref:acyltransferase family protein n=1 Tax=Acidovorax sp. A1169 TaxID=3059524 RepID=UPI002737B73D|nr:acyltransferase family protein [Acidovorax sp. A1169]MDP4075332.1 acyltransferase family protein [Acidovorax sp. A1169]